ncbi:MAG: hypothetical protein M1503_04300 [Thaumarchaeota archaeon]|nr:hypothetical protein [Nitrososphaerota archaeon]MCL5317472.1 hypothetical protein [Nitrososphaerota archaeon]
MLNTGTSSNNGQGLVKGKDSEQKVRFTSTGNERADAELDDQLNIMVDELVKLFGADCSVLLAGGFGRGEGSVKILDNGRIVPLQDFDTYVISNAFVQEHLLNETKLRIRERISERLGFDVAHVGFRVDVEVISPEDLTRLPPDISAYELKVASKVLYGPDKRGFIPLKEADIALSSGAITLFHRAIGLIRHVTPGMLTGAEPIPEEKRFGCIYECCKVYIEICTSFSLLGGFYAPSYRERAELFNKFYRQRFPELSETLSSIPDEVRICTNAKLTSDFSGFSDPVKLWFATRLSYLPCFRFFMGRFLNVDGNVDDQQRYFEQVYRRLRRVFFREYLTQFLRINGFKSSRFLPPAILFSQMYDNLRYVSKAKRIEGGYPSRLTFDWGSPLLKIFISALLLLFAIDELGRVHQKYLDQTERILSGIYPLHKKKNLTLEQRWVYLRDACFKAHMLYFARKPGKIGSFSVAKLLKQRSGIHAH